MRTHFFTGFPGLLASALIRQLIDQADIKKIYALVKREEADHAREKIHEMMQEMGADIPVEITIGDITQPQLGLSERALAVLRSEHLTFWHLAAIYDLAVPKTLAWKVNVDGTREVNKFIQSHPSIERYIYFSTAYVAGMREGLILETELIRPNGFKNHYEETKFEAEVLVEQLKNEVPVTIIRPGIVRGHSQTGETMKFDGPYFILNLIDQLRWLPRIPYIGKTTAKLNVVPIDYVVEATVYLSKSNTAIGQTIHLTDPFPHPFEEIYRAMVIEITGKKPKGRVSTRLARKMLSPLSIQRKLGVELESLDYLTWQAVFDTSNAKRLLKNSGVTCPDFITTLPAMIAYYEQHKNDLSHHVKIE